MSKMRRLLVTALVVVMLSTSLLMPAGVSAASPARGHYATSFVASTPTAFLAGSLEGLLSRLFEMVPWLFRNWVSERSTWVRPGQDAALSVGDVLLRIPGEATEALDHGFRLTMSVERVTGGVVVDLQPDSVELTAHGALLSFGPHVTSAYDDEGNPLMLADPSLWRGNQPAFWIEHFSRYSGWF